MFFSGLFTTALVCLATSSNMKISRLSNLSLLFGVMALICGLISQFIDKDVNATLFWILALFLIPLGIFLSLVGNCSNIYLSCIKYVLTSR